MQTSTRGLLRSQNNSNTVKHTTAKLITTHRHAAHYNTLSRSSPQHTVTQLTTTRCHMQLIATHHHAAHYNTLSHAAHHNTSSRSSSQHTVTCSSSQHIVTQLTTTHCHAAHHNTLSCSRERHGNHYRGNAAVTTVISAGMGEDSENGAVIPQEWGRKPR